LLNGSESLAELQKMANFGEEKGAHPKVQESSYNTACLNDGETKK